MLYKTLFVLFATFSLDYFTKSFTSDHAIVLVQSKYFNFFFQQTSNPNFVFGLPAPKWLVLLTTAVVFLLLLLYWLYQLLLEKKSAYWTALIVGGALGNIINRLFDEGVVDWINISVVNSPVSSFNLADIFILLGILGNAYYAYRD